MACSIFERPWREAQTAGLPRPSRQERRPGELRYRARRREADCNPLFRSTSPALIRATLSFFGVDTDEVGPIAGPRDMGGEFGTGFTVGQQSTILGIQVQVDVNGITFTDRLVFQNDNRSTQTITFTLDNGTGFGIRTGKSIQVNSICNNFLGLNLGPYNVTAESFAMFGCPVATGGAVNSTRRIRGGDDATGL